MPDFEMWSFSVEQQGSFSLGTCGVGGGGKIGLGCRDLCEAGVR